MSPSARRVIELSVLEDLFDAFMLWKNCRKIIIMVFFFGNDLEAAHDCLLVLVTQNC
jgi:hypothetical protein